jgi:uncharacterized protein (UPF0147 family)
MSEIICSACTVETTEDVSTVAVFKNGTEITPAEFLKDATSKGVHPAEAMSALNTMSSHPGLPGYRFKSVIRAVEVQYDKRFDGNAEQAIDAGWQENEFGMVCPGCAGTEEEDPDVTHGSNDFDNLMIRAAAKLAVVKNDDTIGVYITPDCFCGDGTVDVQRIIANLAGAPEEVRFEAAEDVMQVLEGVACDSTDPEAATSLRESISEIQGWLELD